MSKKQSKALEEIGNHWRVNTPTLLDEILNYNPGMGIFETPFRIFSSILGEVAQRAIELNDEKLNALMLRLSLYDVCNPQSKDFDQKFVREYIEKAYNKKPSGK